MTATGLRILGLSTLAMWSGSALVLDRLRWFTRPSLATRIRPYLPSGTLLPDGSLAPDGTGTTGAGVLAVIAPLAREGGTRLARVFGVEEDLARRLRRIHAEIDATEFRLRQLGWCSAAFGGAAAAIQLAPVPPPIALLTVLGAPLLAFLVLEHQIAEASASWKRRLFLELPVVAEQLGMLLGAGYSLGSALHRLATRGHGACARDLRRVCARIGHGVDEVEALREWAALADVDAIGRLVSVLALNRDAGDLSGLITGEARSIRREVHRETIETIERRAEQVWIPVTVATLLPGVLLLAVPFVEALRLFGAS